MEETLELLIVDDHIFYREGVRAMLERVSGLRVVGEASDGTEAVQKVLELQPDVVLMDVRMTGMDGISATREIVAQSPHVRVLMVTMHEDDATVFSALKAGARGYVLKDSTRADLERAIFSVARGEAIFLPGVAERMLGFFLQPHPPEISRETQLRSELTPREQEILRGLGNGLSNLEIAQKLELSPKTVRNYLLNIYSKLQVRDRVQAALLARAQSGERWR